MPSTGGAWAHDASRGIEENTGATQLPLSADELADLNELAGRIGVQEDRYNEHHM
ncbi:hypothetical protein ACWD26_38590 [Streptomyces sp. NPDC002787]